MIIQLQIPVDGISKMITHMIQLNPEERLSCESYLQEYGSLVFPDYFTPFLHKFFSCLIPAEPDARVSIYSREKIIGNLNLCGSQKSNFCFTQLNYVLYIL